MSSEPQTGPPPASLERVQEVLARHRAHLVSRYGAQGIGIGKDGSADLTPKRYRIVVYLESSRNLPKEEVVVEGVQVRFVVTGKFTPL